MKTCHKCKITKRPEEFPANKSKKDGRSETCLACKREYNRLHYQNNKQYYIDKAQKQKDSLRELFREYKSELKCARCGQDHPATLHFHHEDPSQKDITVSQAIGRSWPLARIREEITKCSVLCANCHAIHHWEEKHAR